MSRLAVAFAAAALTTALAGAAAAQEPRPQYRAQDVIDAYAGKAAQSRCPAGTIAADDGVCDPAPNTRGFSLAAPSSTGGASAGAAPAASGRAAGSREARARTGSYRPSAPLRANVTPGDLLITFRLGSDELTPQARANARAFADALKSPALSSMRFALGGHTDVSGSADSNKTLSQARAEAVKGFLVAEGVPATRLEAQGYGAERLADPARPRAATNRRVEALRLN